MSICQLRGLHHDPFLYIYGSPIPVVEEAKFLGLLFDKKLSFIPHIKALKARCLKDTTKFAANPKNPAHNCVFIQNTKDFIIIHLRLLSLSV